MTRRDGHEPRRRGTCATPRSRLDVSPPGVQLPGVQAESSDVAVSDEVTVERLREVADELFGLDELRPAQVEAAAAVLDGRDVLLILPTGAGKSLAYQLPAVLINGPTVVISPLLALQRDQIEHLEARGEQTRAVRLSSAETPAQRAQALAEVADGAEFLFLAPEQLANAEVLERVADLKPTLVAVDEAHCVSTWGHDFRPDYLRLGELVEQLGAPRIVALTATAAPPVRDDIVSRLRLKRPLTIVKGLARENIALSVVRCVTGGDQERAVRERVLSADGPGIVYVGTRKAAEEYADAFVESGRRAEAYHAGLRKSLRDDVQARFFDGGTDVIVATSAFGMGLDKPDIRFVFHANVPESPDAYYQEVGRAGRDGEAAVAVLFYRPEDLSLARFFTAGVPKSDDVARVVGAVDGWDLAAMDRRALAERLGMGPRRLGRILGLLSEVSAEASGTSGSAAGGGSGVDADTDGAEDTEDPEQRRARLVEAISARAEAHRALQKSRIEMMRAYAETTSCRRQFLLGYFGEESSDLCGRCDNCREGSSSAAEADTRLDGAAAFAVQSRVEHAEFGPGVVMSVDGDVLTVLFETVGYRTLHLPTVLERALLTGGRG
jgi:ATP-dependent DNA helicase RecQ